MPSTPGQDRTAGIRRLVLKVGSRLLTGGTPELLRERMELFADAVARHRSVQTAIVSSGAVAAGYRALGLARVPEKVRERQAAAAVGQSRLMRLYAELFGSRGLDVGQVLLTQDCLWDRRRYLSSRATMDALFQAGVVPVVNENDTVSVGEVRIGDNDNLAAHTAALIEADALVLLTDVAGVYDRDPQGDAGARLIPRAASAAELRSHCWPKRAPESTGGMATKLDAAEKAAKFGIPTVIASGSDPEALESVFQSRPTGTFIPGAPDPLTPSRHWLAVQARPPGGLVVDEGALVALCSGGVSLLPSGVLEVRGRFEVGDVVSIVDSSGVERARGVTAYDDREVARIRGLHSSEIETVLGYRGKREIVKSDKIVVLEKR